MSDISFIILTYNESVHLRRLLSKIVGINAPVFVIDSGSTDDTVAIAEEFGAVVKVNTFENHPKQWDFALKNCLISTPWIIGLDADQYPSEELLHKLKTFSDIEVPADVNGIYFNRHNYFQGERLKYGGYRNFYMLKMFRNGKGWSDLNENMDHRFIVEGKSIIWKNEVLIEDNLKEHDIDFWLTKQIRYSNLTAQEEFQRKKGLRGQTLTPNLLGNPDERTAFLKKIWWNLPLFIRPMIYFFYRFVIRLGFLETTSGRLFHFLQGFWFRFLVDAKIKELEKQEKLQAKA
ncbi:glycosyltransferase family 2 protein [Emticicia sp. 21SJ11W-3]|uniref:glycosyltransferase family 2 protein n=1 Tax=Emticicia sp. 21SJ11W-3 TaxID=2916755 RepID=UPI00209DC02C|nr:glycosyltransferase family 2 protein [Emticicia sp. 21SJ11W-3]UTA68982.1 glycosyltransferase family 2 protein [Emticicia sp. 21SJ11W-3]